jgi:hypothetical protein
MDERGLAVVKAVLAMLMLRMIVSTAFPICYLYV